ncbi:MAG: hypothetical protein LBQ49_00830, partial [Rickettsiales bacterium]|nr:hypothetical protein [Rickettsiales bacterium]
MKSGLKEFLIITFFFIALAPSAHAASFCRKTVTCADLKTAWNNDTTQLTAAYPDGYGYGAGYENVP